MDQVNAVVVVNPKRLNVPTVTFKARVGHSFVAVIRGVPDDCTGVYLRVFSIGGSYYDIPANYHPGDKDYVAYIVGTSFPKVGEFRYEVHAFDYQGNRTALAEGIVHVDTFSVTNSPSETSDPVSVARIPTDTGAYVNIQYVWDGFDWVAKAVLED